MPANQTSSNYDPGDALVESIISTAPFSDLPRNSLDALAVAASDRRYAAGETIFAMGQYDGSEFLIVRSGKIKASHVDPASGSMIFEEVGAGQIFGLAQAILGDDAEGAQTVTVLAERNSEIIAVDADALRELAAHRPKLTRVLMLHFAARIVGGMRSEEESSPERRVYAALCGYVERDAVSAQWRINKMPKHRELADQADAEEAIAASAVAKLIQSGVARRDYPGLIIDDMAQLNRLAR
ncbi:MAG: cyclic nucleotide-binding domain-containing protein [Parvularculaceae bacterium]|nr:cyclic nucleotide-binding domain-containing protein [Parvularculaceae bacterium]